MLKLLDSVNLPNFSEFLQNFDVRNIMLLLMILDDAAFFDCDTEAVFFCGLWAKSWHLINICGYEVAGTLCRAAGISVWDEVAITSLCLETDSTYV